MDEEEGEEGKKTEKKESEGAKEIGAKDKEPLAAPKATEEFIQTLARRLLEVEGKVGELQQDLKTKEKLIAAQSKSLAELRLQETKSRAEIDSLRVQVNTNYYKNDCMI